jgi:hypothetical protein
MGNSQPKRPTTPPTSPVKAVIPVISMGILASQQNLSPAVQVCWRGRVSALAVIARRESGARRCIVDVSGVWKWELKTSLD